MKRLPIKALFLREERGFSLPEMMTTIVIMIVVLFALYSIFDMSLRVFSFGNNKTEAVEITRLGLEKMEREIRGAYRYDSDAGQDHLFFSTASPGTALAVPPTSITQITFGNDLNGSGKVECPNANDCEYITYKLTDNASNAVCTVAPCTLRRVTTNNSGDWGDPVVENVVPNGLAFTYYKSDGTTPANEGEIGRVQVSLETAVNPGTDTAGRQELTTEIDLRNRQ